MQEKLWAMHLLLEFKWFYKMKKSAFFVVLTGSLLLTGCTTDGGLKEAEEPLLNKTNSVLSGLEITPDKHSARPDDSQKAVERCRNTEQKDALPKRTEKKRPPERPKTPVTHPEQPDSSLPTAVEPSVSDEAEEQNALTPEVPEVLRSEPDGITTPRLPELRINPNFLAPEKFQHPLQTSEKLVFMLGEDDQGNYLYSEGAITDGAYDKFLRYVDHYAKNGVKLDRLMMHSPGGMLAEGIKIGQYIRDNNWTTDLDKHMRCYSSCAMIYAAGVNKRMQSGAEVGYHRPYLPGVPDTPELVQQVYLDYQPYWQSVHGDPKLYDDFMKNYGRDDMLVLTAETAPKRMIIEKY